MYILFALLISFFFYRFLLIALRLSGHLPKRLWPTALGSCLILVVTLIVFNFASRAVGIDLGPGHAVSYSIPDDYLAKGTLGVMALLPYALACLAPLISFFVLRRRLALR